VFYPILGTLYRQCTYASGLTALRQLVLVQRQSPGFNVLVHLLLVLQASGEGGELWRRGPRWMPHHLHQALPLLIGMADNHTPVIVIARMGAIGVVRRHRWPTVIVDERRVGPVGAIAGGKTGTARRSPVGGEVQERWTVEGNTRHHLRLINMLALARHVAMIQTGKGTHRTV